jgi:hypothetical protein
MTDEAKVPMTEPSISELRPHPRTSDEASVSYRAKHIRALFTEIDRLRHDLDRQMAIAQAETERAERAEREADKWKQLDVEGALREAREYVARELFATLECVCLLDKETLEPIRSTIDPEEVEAVEEIETALARIDAVLTAGAQRGETEG